jgi:hypothetical protein
MRNLHARLVLIALLGAGLACNAPGTVEPTSELQQPASPTLEPESQDLPTATPVPDLTPEPAAATAEPRPLRIVYAADDELWALELGSAPTLLATIGGVSEVRISDDGERLVYAVRDPEQDTTELRGINFDGSNDRVLLDPGAFDALYPLDGALHYTLSQISLVPETHVAMFNTRAVFEGPGLAKNNDLLTVDADTGALTRILDRGDGGDFTLSPDGTQLAITRPDSIGFVSTDGTDLRPERLTFPWVITYSEYFYYPFPVWSEASVLVAIPSEDPFFAPLTGAVWTVPADGSESSLLTTIKGNFFAPQGAISSISPDGNLVGYYDTDSSSGMSWLVIQTIGDDAGTIYGIDALDWKGWAPGSDYFVYTTGSGPELYLGRMGAEPVMIGSGSGLQWIGPTEFLYLSGSRGDWTLTLSAIEGESVPLVELSAKFVSYDFAR